MRYLALPFRVEKRAAWERPKTLLVALAGLLLGVTLSLALGLAAPGGPQAIAWAFAEAMLPKSMPMLVEFAAPVSLSAIGLALAYRAGFYTIGAEGQVLLGAAAGLMAALYLGLPPSKPLVLATATALGVLAGIALSLATGILRLVRVNEVLSSLMLNYVAMYTVNYLVSGPWSIGMFTKTAAIPPGYRLGWPEILAILLAATLLYWFIESRTGIGVAMEAYGSSRRAAETYGVKPSRIVLIASLVSGASAGLGGVLLLYGFQYALYSMSQPPGYGYMGVLAAWLAGRSVIGSLLAGLFFSYIMVAGTYLQYYGVPFNTVLAIQAIMVLSVTSTQALSRYRFTLARVPGRQ